MKAFFRLGFLALALAAIVAPATAQQAVIENCTVVSSAPTYTAGTQRPCTQDTSGNQRIVASGSSSSPLLPDLTATGSVTSATTIISSDVSGYSLASVQFTSVGSGVTVVFEQSADNTNWIDAIVTTSNTGNLAYNNGVSTGAVSLATSFSYTSTLRLRYFRVRVSVYGSGTVTAFATYKQSGAPIVAPTVATDSGVDCCGQNVNSRNHVSGPIGWEKVRGVFPNTLFSSAARTATSQSSDQTNRSWRGLICVINVTAASATPSVVFTIQGKDSVSSVYYTHLASAAITGTGTTVLRVYPGLTAAANLTANDVLSRTWRIDATHADADSITYSVGCDGIV